MEDGERIEVRFDDACERDVDRGDRAESREDAPGGVLFEIATDTPGFDIDEPLLELGRSLKLPPWLQPSHDQIAAALPPLPIDALHQLDPEPAATA